ncbi:MAG: tRNA preQ1(34) S-adenosylmethionine ribosyltransferase-isomerase QueA [Pseudomonadales bacterium]|nr:tRNA preQ1(34) S-adenosylmethionine ribosyltransferase-isomerase QueA [Pseudomonadales bacterium]
MKLSEFDYLLPESLIAKYPLEQRSDSRLLLLDGNNGAIQHSQFNQLVDQLEAGDLLVFNNTRVIPARLFGQKQSGGKIELLVERLLDDQSVLAQIRASKSPKPGSTLLFDNYSARVLGRQGALFEVEFIGEQNVFSILEQIGHVPLPPYIDRADAELDLERYQTVYAEHPGAVAAPTAGLHFDQSILDALEAKGVNSEFVTLHVGAGTYQPVRCENIEEHQMHSEYIDLSEGLCQQVRDTKKAGGKVIAVGTTALRCLETASQTGEIKPFKGDTDIFIYPGYQFQTVDRLLTNFHLPKSSLIMLVSAFAGYKNTMSSYAEAVEQQYRFFSYGDAMLITRQLTQPERTTL